MSSAIDAILGKKSSAPVSDASSTNPKGVEAALADDAAEPETYRPYFIRPHPQLMFSVIERDGTEHCFQYHTLRHLKHQTRNGQEFVSFTADGLAVVMQGTALRVVLLGLKRYALSELRENDGKPAGGLPTRIDRLEVQDAQEQIARTAPRLVK